MYTVLPSCKLIRQPKARHARAFFCLSFSFLPFRLLHKFVKVVDVVAFTSLKKYRADISKGKKNENIL